MRVYVKSSIGDVDAFNEYIKNNYVIYNRLGNYQQIELSSMEALHKFISEIPDVIKMNDISPIICPDEDGFIIRFDNIY